MINSNSTYLFYANISKLSKDKYQKYYDMLPPSRRMNVDFMAYEEDRRRSVFAYALLYESLKLYDVDITKYAFQVDVQGKPYFDNCPIKFNISHSGDFVAICISLEDAGCDIQEIVVRDFDNLIPILMNDDEAAYHATLQDKEKHLNFFKVWSKKESYLKMLGSGLTKSMKSFDAGKPDNGANIYSVSMNDKFYLSCCYKTPNLELPKEINL